MKARLKASLKLMLWRFHSNRTDIKATPQYKTGKIKALVLSEAM